MEEPLRHAMDYVADSRSVICGRHAFDLAESLSGEINRLRNAREVSTTRLFIAAPGAFTFYLGQRQPGMGSVALYEFDFEGAHGASYELALQFPVR
jgi:hypothetical protein